MSKKNRQENQKNAAQVSESGSRLTDYFWANLIFFAFLTTLSYVVWVSCQAPSDDQAVKLVLADTFKFMILLFGGGFLVVTLFDAAYDFFAEKAAKKSVEGYSSAGSTKWERRLPGDGKLFCGCELIDALQQKLMPNSEDLVAFASRQFLLLDDSVISHRQ